MITITIMRRRPAAAMSTERKIILSKNLGERILLVCLRTSRQYFGKKGISWEFLQKNSTEKVPVISPNKPDSTIKFGKIAEIIGFLRKKI